MKVLIAGDFSSRYRTTAVIESGNYDKPFGAVKNITSLCDYSVINLECPVIERETAPIIKQGPNLYGSKKMVEAIKYMGFTGVTLANNHFFDQGEKGVQETIQALESYSIDHVGGGANLGEASKILYKTIGGDVLAIINCCENEFSIASENKGGSNPLNPQKQFYAIKDARGKADFVIVIVHGGHEHFQLPSPRMVETYRFFIDAGADAVINHHQHCYSGYEIYNGKPIFYGLGNFLFDNDPLTTNSPWNYGYCVQLSLSKGSNTSYVIYPYRQCAEEVRIEFLEPNAFDRDLKKLNEVISDTDLLKSAINKYFHNSMTEVEHFLNPYQNRIMRGLMKYSIIPTVFKNKWLLKLQNYICCESHRDKVEYYLKNKGV